MDIRIATAADEREQIFRFRYALYVELMGRRQHYADHTARRIEEPLDRAGHLFGAWDGERLVGTVRVNLGRESDLGYYVSLYRLGRFGTLCLPFVSVTTKLMVAPSHRGTTVAMRLALAAYEFALGRDVMWDFIDCNDPLVPFFCRLGYRVHRPSIEHPEYGIVNPMVLAVADLEHLERVGSPFARVCRKNPKAPAPAAGGEISFEEIHLAVQRLETERGIA